MNFLKLPLACLLIISIAIALPVAGQQKRRTQSSTKSPAAPAPAPPTFDTLLAADAFKVYAEVRGLGQLIRSSAANDVLEPILKLGQPPKEFQNFVNWARLHADQLMTSRMLVAAWPTYKDVPYAVIAIEFSSAEEAAKFEPQFNSALSSVLPPTIPQSSPEADKPNEQKQANEKPKEQEPAIPRYHLQRAGALVVFSPTPVQLKKLRPAGSKLLSEDANFRVAYNRFSSEPIFVFVDFQAIQKEQEERVKEYEEQRKKAEEARKALEQQKEQQKKGQEPEGEGNDEMEAPEVLPNSALGQLPPEVREPPKEPSDAEVLSGAINVLQYSFFVGQPKMPDALGIGFSPENESFDVRALMIDSPGNTSDPVPFFSGLTFGPPISPQSPNVLPADSELVMIMSLDLPQIHARLSAPELSMPTYTIAGIAKTGETPAEVAGPMATIERVLKINTRDDLLPLLGSEIAMSMPVESFGLFSLPRAPQPQSKENANDPKPEPRTPFIVLSLRDREGMRKLMPRLLEGFGGKAAASLVQTERREDTELVSFGTLFAYAFVGDFLVLAGNATTTRSVVDSYLKNQTLASDVHFRNYTRWQPRQQQGQIYVSPAFMESYKTWANNPNSHLTDESRAFMTRLTAATQPITYSLSNDGLGAMHELHLPRNLLLLAVSGIAAAENPPKTYQNERAAMGLMWSILGAERSYKIKKGSTYASLEELIEAQMVSKESLERSGYKFEVTLTADGFEITAVPVEHGKTGNLSFFLDHTGVMRGADRGGAAASSSDNPIN
jgi:hypothetical protein